MTTRYIQIERSTAHEAADTMRRTAPKPVARRRRRTKKRRRPVRLLLALLVLAAAAWVGLRFADGARAEADWAARGIGVQEGTAAAITRLAHQDQRCLLYTSFTTFSTFSLETLHLLEEGRMAAGLLYAGLSVVLCVAGVYVGNLVAHMLLRRGG